MAWVLLLWGCSTLRPPPASVLEAVPPADASLAQQVRELGIGLRFLNAPVPAGASTPEVGAEYVYARAFSANARNSPVGIEVWVYGEGDAPLHGAHEAYLRGVYRDIYGWDPADWKAQLGDSEGGPAILREKSDFFWESLAQQLAERVFSEAITPAVYRFGPQCLDGAGSPCQDAGLAEARRVVVRTYLDARRDLVNPVTRSITYSVHRGQVVDPELIFELQVPNGLRVAGPHAEHLDFRPLIGGRQDAVGDIRLWAHVPQGRRTRTNNTDYPDYNLLFVPLRHLAVQGEVDDPKVPASGVHYPDTEALIDRVRALVSQLRTPSGGREVAARLTPFLTAKYYYMFEAGGQGITSYRDYILGARAGVARGLNPDFGRIELEVDGARAASFQESEQTP